MRIDSIYKMTLPDDDSEGERYVHIDLNAIVSISSVTVQKGGVLFSVAVILRDTALVFGCYGEWRREKMDAAHDQLLRAWRTYKEVSDGH